MVCTLNTTHLFLFLLWRAHGGGRSTRWRRRRVEALDAALLGRRTTGALVRRTRVEARHAALLRWRTTGTVVRRVLLVPVRTIEVLPTSSSAALQTLAPLLLIGEVRLAIVFTASVGTFATPPATSLTVIVFVVMLSVVLVELTITTVSRRTVEAALRRTTVVRARWAVEAATWRPVERRAAVLEVLAAIATGVRSVVEVTMAATGVLLLMVDDRWTGVLVVLKGKRKIGNVWVIPDLKKVKPNSGLRYLDILKNCIFI